MADSILNTIKINLDIEITFTGYDTELITAINTTLEELNELDIGSEEVFAITGAVETWEDFLGEASPELETAKSYISLRTRLLFIPPVNTDINSILNTVKASLGVELAYSGFDTDIILAINTSLMTLTQVGVGPEEGFSITGTEETWDEFLTNAMKLEAAKSYVNVNTRLLFDPPPTSFVLDAMKNQANEILWRLSVEVEPIVEV